MSFKATGLLAGVSDIIVIIDKVYFIEIKTETGSQSKEQKEFQEIVTNLNQEYLIIKSLNEFKIWLNNTLPSR